MTHELFRMCACVANRAYQALPFGRCQPGYEIKSISECTAAAKALGAPITSALSDGLYGSHSYPPFCYYSNGVVKFNAGNNKGICDYSKKSICLCAFSRTYMPPQPAYTTSPFNNTTYPGAFPWWDGYMHCFTLDELSR